MNKSSPLTVTRLRHAVAAGRRLAPPLEVEVDFGRVMEGVRDRIADWVWQTYGGRAAWVNPFLGHLAKVGRYKLDGFSTLEFLLEEYNVRLVFWVVRDVEHQMVYRLPSLAVEPDPTLARPRGVFGWLLE
jgi:hypothetical protein